MRWMTCISILTVGILLPLVAHAQGDDALTVAARQISDQFVKSSAARKAEVLKVDQTTTPPNITVMLGTEDGVLEGQLLQILAKGEPLTDENGKVVDFEWMPVGNAEVTLVTGDKTCVAKMVGPVVPGRLAKGNRAMVKTIPGALAVSAFVRDDGAGSVMGTEFADKLVTALQSSGRFRVLERSGFETLLAALKLGLNDLFDPMKTVPLGKQLQAKGVVMGKIDQQNAGYTISARVVDVETGAVVGTATTTCGRSDELDKKYSQGGPPPPPPTAQALFSKEMTWMNANQGACLEENVSIGGVFWPQAIRLNTWVTIATQGKLGLIAIEVGVRDGHIHGQKLEILTDGVAIKTVPLADNMRPIRVPLDLTNVQSVKFQTQGQAYGAWISQPGVKMEVPQQ